MVHRKSIIVIFLISNIQKPSTFKTYHISTNLLFFLFTQNTSHNNYWHMKNIKYYAQDNMLQSNEESGWGKRWKE